MGRVKIVRCGRIRLSSEVSRSRSRIRISEPISSECSRLLGWLSLSQTRRLHAWLGKWISEQEGE